eukprot:PLAT15858.1.p1 GENE.PLAT15858.1~~PLAT15858.1.p1  ORF type:complete len:741 (-),score=251.82 PLAT15858.1:83-2305(-)
MSHALLSAAGTAALSLLAARRRCRRQRDRLRARPQLLWADEIDNSPDEWQCKSSYHYIDERSVFKPSEEQLASDESDASVVPSSMRTTPLIWVRTPKKLAWLARHLQSQAAIGLDLENHGLRSYSGFVCLMQLSTTDCDYLIDTLLLRKSMALLQPVFADGNVLKIMHGATNDIKWLQRDFGLYMVGLFDTAIAARALGFVSTSLAKLLAHYFDVHIDKSFQLADWRQRPLPADMKLYARGDSHYLIPLLRRMKAQLLTAGGGITALQAVFDKSVKYTLRAFSKREVTDCSFIRPLLKAAAEDSASKEDDADGAAAAVEESKDAGIPPRCAKAYSDLFMLRDKLARRADESHYYMLSHRAMYAICMALPTSGEDVIAAAGGADAGAMLRKPAWLAAVVTVCRAARAAEAAALPDYTAAQLRARRTHSKSTRTERTREVIRKAPVYENCTLLGKDGTALAKCDRRKAEWYLERDLADIVSEKPLIVKLRFQQKGPGHSGDAFHMAPKVNQCIVCGSTDAMKLVRCYVCPHSYRRHFPESGKSYTSHDVILLCAACNTRAKRVLAGHQATLAKRYGVPLSGIGPKHFTDTEKQRVQSAAQTLLRQKGKLPEHRVEAMMKILREYFDVEGDVTNEQLQMAVRLRVKYENPDYESHSEAVMRIVMSAPDMKAAVQQFVEDWRQAFVDGCCPAYPQTGWRIDYPVFRDEDLRRVAAKKAKESGDDEPPAAPAKSEEGGEKASSAP